MGRTSLVVREFKIEDYDEICRWAKNEFEGLYPDITQISKTSFVCEDEDGVIGFVSVILTNCKRYCLVENLLSNPDYAGRKVKEATEMLNDFVGHFAKALQYMGVMALAPSPILMRRYRQLGFKETIENVTIMMREV